MSANSQEFLMAPIEQPQVRLRSTGRHGEMSHREMCSRELTPGEVAHRAGVSVSALHFYEREGLISSSRTVGNQRRYHCDMLRRIAFVRVSQSVGISLSRIRAALETLPRDHSPTKADWARLSRSWREELDERIAALQRLREQLDGCIGCGCLSLKSCSLYNRNDELRETGSGPRRMPPSVNSGALHAAAPIR